MTATTTATDYYSSAENNNNNNPLLPDSPHAQWGRGHAPTHRCAGQRAEWGRGRAAPQRIKRESVNRSGLGRCRRHLFPPPHDRELERRQSPTRTARVGRRASLGERASLRDTIPPLEPKRSLAGVWVRLASRWCPGRREDHTRWTGPR